MNFARCFVNGACRHRSLNRIKRVQNVQHKAGRASDGSVFSTCAHLQLTRTLSSSSSRNRYPDFADVPTEEETDDVNALILSSGDDTGALVLGWDMAHRTWTMPSLEAHMYTLGHPNAPSSLKARSTYNLKELLTLVNETGKSMDFFTGLAQEHIVTFLEQATEQNDDLVHVLDLVSVWYFASPECRRVEGGGGDAGDATGPDRKELTQALFKQIKAINASDRTDGAYYSGEMLKGLCDLYGVDFEEGQPDGSTKHMQIKKGDAILDLLYESTVAEFFKQADESFLAPAAEGDNKVQFETIQSYFQNVGDYLLLMSEEMH
jgi:hypothetical protein